MSSNRETAKNTDVHVALDLGSDTLKIAYAFKIDGTEYTGKIVNNNYAMSALPAVAVYNVDDGKWYFCEDVTKMEGSSYVTVVKIKRLMTLVKKVEDDGNESRARAVTASNADYYKNKNHFPKFYFSLDGKKERKRNDSEKVNYDELDFDLLVQNEKTFIAKDYTPKKVCEMYFAHVAEIVNGRVQTLMKKFDCGYNIRLSIVYPPHVGAEFTNELERVILLGFKAKSVKFSLSMTKALSILASQRNLLRNGESALIFNIGEEKTFVAKTDLEIKGKERSISIDGVEGHKLPADLGGNDIDRAVGVYFDKFMRNREIMGSPTAGKAGHVYESGLSSKDYLFVQDIKTAKMYLAMYGKDDDIFGKGVSVRSAKSLCIDMKLTHDEFSKCIGIKSENDSVIANSFMDKICDYIEDELDRSINRNVTRVFISGGVTETYKLVDVIKERLKGKVCPETKSKIVVGTFESESSKPYRAYADGFEIYSHEDATYAPALGCAIAALNNVKVKTVTSLTYGTDLRYNGNFFFTLLLDKREEIPDEGRKAVEVYPVGACAEGSLYIFSLNLSDAEMAAGKFRNDSEVKVEYMEVNAPGYSGRYHLSLGRLIKSKKDENYVKKLEKKIGYRQRNKDSEIDITFYHNNRRVRFTGIGVRDRYGWESYWNTYTKAETARTGKPLPFKNQANQFFFDAGIEINGFGEASPHASNNLAWNRYKWVNITYMDNNSTGVVQATDIEVRSCPFTVKIESKD